MTRRLRTTASAAIFAAAAIAAAATLSAPAAAVAQTTPRQDSGATADVLAVAARAEQLGLLLGSPQAAEQLRIGVLRRLLDTAPLPEAPTIVANPQQVDMTAGWGGEEGGDSQEAEIASAARGDLAARTGGQGDTLRQIPQAQPGASSGAAGTAAPLACPVAGPVAFINDWGFPRSGGRQHRGNDLFAAQGTPIVAVRTAVITRVSRVDRGLGGLTVSYIDHTGDRWYNAHLSAIPDDIVPGRIVSQGQIVGYVGRTGNARTTPPHNHIQWHPGNGGPVNPYPLLRPACN